MDDQSTDPKESDNKPQNDHLEDVKRQAMHALTPLLADIKDMDPERKFDICMSAMRYTDNKELANAALEAALDINENSTKAEALVELINEINYLQQA
jgi:poly-gamma-glutamate capsule biosynthesis protein CapA/YwtB (metallophosphatase superfamily)